MPNSKKKVVFVDDYDGFLHVMQRRIHSDNLEVTTYHGMVDQYGPAMAFDDDPDTRWATDYGTHQAWLEVDLGSPQKIHRATIHEAYAPRIRKFELQRKEGDAWITFAEGGQIAEEASIRFEPVDAQVVRLQILEATEGPTIWEFQLFPEGQ